MEETTKCNVFKKIIKNIQKFYEGGQACKCRFSEETICKCANAKSSWYRRSKLQITNFILSLEILGIKRENSSSLVNILNYDLKSLW